ncbi:MAG TPA: hypothetical protein VHO67_13040 [Polyangia bacterium]|nr:hypothetical protein [Polyangia bacterium]
MSVPMVATEVVRERLPPIRADVDRGSRNLPLPVIREMLLMLDSLTIAGQRHLMEKVVKFVEEEVPRTAVGLSRRNQAAVDAIIDQLRRESDRLVPDVCAFTRGAESLLALVAALE